MKYLLLTVAAASLLFAGCSKDDDGDVVTNTWSVNGMRHPAVNIGRLGGNTTIFVNDGNGTSGSGMNFVFAGAPTSGTYRIVDYPTKPNEVLIVATEGSALNAYRSTGTAAENRTVLVGINDQKATIFLSSATLEGVLPGAGNIEVTASLREN